jgi:hypothetical protein
MAAATPSDRQTQSGTSPVGGCPGDEGDFDAEAALPVFFDWILEQINSLPEGMLEQRECGKGCYVWSVFSPIFNHVLDGPLCALVRV